MSTPLIYPTTTNAVQKTLDASLLTGVTASATLNNVTGIQNLKGLMVIDRVDGNNNLTPTKREYVSFAGTSGSTVVTLVRGLAGSTDQDHAIGAIVEFVNDVVQQQAIIDGLLLTVGADGTLSGSAIDTDSTMAANSDTKIASQKATKTYVDGKVTAVDGWIAVTGAWTYASATTITVPSGAASLYSIGDKIKFTQTTVKYFYITAVADTLLTVRAGNEYAVANATISAISYSHQSSPVGFPSRFAITKPTFSGTSWTNQPATWIGYFYMVGKHCFAEGYLQTASSGTGTGVWTLTFTTSELPNIYHGVQGTGGVFNLQNCFIGGQDSVPNAWTFFKYDSSAPGGNSAYITFSCNWSTIY